MGLKLEIRRERLMEIRGPQSNQRGIETLFLFPTKGGRDGPQSNQRGIETFYELIIFCHQQGLNRTSVGLKPVIRRVRVITNTGPQSNQRGIETLVPVPQKRTDSRASIEPAWD